MAAELLDEDIQFLREEIRLAHDERGRFRPRGSREWKATQRCIRRLMAQAMEEWAEQVWRGRLGIG